MIGHGKVSHEISVEDRDLGNTLTANVFFAEKLLWPQALQNAKLDENSTRVEKDASWCGINMGESTTKSNIGFYEKK